jgi:hypothetical protein
MQAVFRGVSALLYAFLVTPVAAITPALEPKSHDKFFDHDYPDDHRPAAPQHDWQYPYPIVQDSEDYDLDFVKDENSDGGEWKVQQEYDTLRGKLAKEQELLKAAKMREKVSSETDYVEKEVHSLTDCETELSKARAKLRGLTEAQTKAVQEMKDADVNEASAEENKAAKEKAIDDLKKQIDKAMEDHEAALKTYEETNAKFLKFSADLKVAETNLRHVRRKDVDPDGGVYYLTPPPPKSAPAPAPGPVAPAPKPPAPKSGAAALLATSPAIVALVTMAASCAW